MRKFLIFFCKGCYKMIEDNNEEYYFLIFLKALNKFGYWNRYPVGNGLITGHITWLVHCDKVPSQTGTFIRKGHVA